MIDGKWILLRLENLNELIRYNNDVSKNPTNPANASIDVTSDRVKSKRKKFEIQKFKNLREVVNPENNKLKTNNVKHYRKYSKLGFTFSITLF